MEGNSQNVKLWRLTEMDWNENLTSLWWTEISPKATLLHLSYGIFIGYYTLCLHMALEKHEDTQDYAIVSGFPYYTGNAKYV